MVYSVPNWRNFVHRSCRGRPCVVPIGCVTIQSLPRAASCYATRLIFSLPDADHRTPYPLDTDGQTRDLPGSGAIPLHLMWPLTMSCDWVRNDPVPTTRGWLVQHYDPFRGELGVRPAASGQQGISLMDLGKRGRLRVDQPTITGELGRAPDAYSQLFGCNDCTFVERLQAGALVMRRGLFF